MDKIRKWYLALSIALTVTFFLLGTTIFNRSFVRFAETLGDLFSSARYYGCEIFGVEHNLIASVTEESKVLEWNYILPTTSEGFERRTSLLLRLLINGNNISGYTQRLGRKAETLSRLLVLLLPGFLLVWILITKMYGANNTKYNYDTRPLQIFKKISARIYQPIKLFVLGTSLRISLLELYQTYLIGSPCVTEAAKVIGSGV